MNILSFTAVNATPTDAGLSFSVPAEKVRYQVDLGGLTTATIEVYGRLAPSLPWVELGSHTAAALAEVPAYPYMGAALTALTGAGTATVSFDF